jgi:hypothetical protein
MKYAAKMASDGMIYMPSFINIHSGVQKLLGVDTHKDTDSNVNSLAYYLFSK